MGIEPTRSAWKAEVLPLNYIRTACLPFKRRVIFYHITRRVVKQFIKVFSMEKYRQAGRLQNIHFQAVLICRKMNACNLSFTVLDNRICDFILHVLADGVP